MSTEDEKIRVTHPFELLRLAAHGTPEEQIAARAEYERRIEAEPHAAAGYCEIRTTYFIATAHAFAVVQRAAQDRYDRVAAVAPWFSPRTPGDPPPEA